MTSVVVVYSLAPAALPEEGPDLGASLRAALTSFGVREERPDSDGAAGRQLTSAPTLVPLRGSHWLADDFDLLEFDERIWRALDGCGRCEVRLQWEGLREEELLRLVRQVVTRYQRYTPVRNVASAGPLFSKILAAHARLHDRSKPLVAADHDHALDTWCWVVRLAPQASLALQTAALFHDVERLQTESEIRVEQHASDYTAFKAAHAAAGGRLVAEVLSGLGVPPEVVQRTQDLVTEHEVRRQDDAEGAVLNEADALSFFSLNASGFLKYYGPAHTERKVAYTWARLSATGRRELDHIKLAPQIRAWLPVNAARADHAPHRVHDQEPWAAELPARQQGGGHDAAGNRPSA